jgi:hypothetical protein
MAKRKRLADLVREEVDSEEKVVSPTPEAPPVRPHEAPDSPSQKPTDLQTYRLTDSVSPDKTVPVRRSERASAASTIAQPESPASPPTPKYLRLTRKEARLREDQIEALASLARRLNKQRRGRGERITENTLIRVAVDLLLEKQGDLRGVSEEELAKMLLR